MSEEQEGKSAMDAGAASAALLRGEWPDLYALLGASPDADVETLRKHIRVAYVEATTNADHRNIARRIHFQTMAEQVLPQCHRILLDPKTRAAYDEQSLLHRAGDARARQYESFIANTLGDEKTSRDQNDSMILGSAAPSPQDAHDAEMAAARALLESLQRGGARRTTAPEESSNREDAQMRARFSADEAATQNELSSSATETTSAIEAEAQREQSQNDAIEARLNARIAPPEPSADLSSVAEDATRSAAASSRAANAPETDAAAAPSQDAPRDRRPTRERRASSGENSADAAAPRGDASVPAARAATPPIAPESSAASTRSAAALDQTAMLSTTAQNEASAAANSPTGAGATSNAKASTDANAATNANAAANANPLTGADAKARAATANGATFADSDAVARAAQAKRAADARLKNEIESRRNARRAADNETAGASTRDLEAPRAASAPRNVTAAAAAFNAAENAADATPTQAPVDDFTVAPEFRSEKFGVDVSQLPTHHPPEVLPTFAEQTASTRADASGAATDSMARDFDDAPAGTRTAQTIFAPRVSLGENADSMRAAGAKTPAKRVLSATARNLFVGLIGGALGAFIIWRSNQNVAPVLTPLPLVCASELYPFMQRAEAAFEAAPEGEGIDVNLSPVDAREAMSALLNPKTAPPAAWIPSETLWSDRYNAVVEKSGRPPIRVARPLALSPLVLLARGDQASALRQKFPDHKIGSWVALQDAVQSFAAGHFGLADPVKSASGGIARLFMAQEWCAKNGLECNEKTLADPRLWKWLSNFENAVPSYGKLTGDMAKSLALGTADRYWWALVYESDAIFWMKQKKNLEVFYLPVSNYADHPFCRIGENGAGKRDEFEKFLRAPAMQKVLLESGFRPADSDLSIGGGNPFTSADLKKRGLKIKGFRIDDRINYRLLNALNAQWAKRYKS